MPRRHPQRRDGEAMPLVNPHAAGLDIGSAEIWACGPEDRDRQPVRPFGPLTPDRYALAGWLTACRIEPVAMASTGVSGMPVYEILEARGFTVHLVNARPLTHVPGRNSAAQDGQWLQHLPTWGLVRGACRPEAEMGARRAYFRHRALVPEPRAAHLQHRPNALPPMNVPLPQVLTDISGVTGLTMLRALVAGERDAVQLARCRDRRGASRPEDIANALTGHDPPAQVFALTQALAVYDADPEPVRACDAAIERRLQALTPVWPEALPPLNRANTHRTHHKNAPLYDARGRLDQRAGVDLVAIPGLQASTVPTMLADIGLDPRQWPHAKALCAWLGRAPRHEISGGKILRRSTLRPHNRAGQAFRLAAHAVSRSQNRVGAF
jgi:transposase